MAHRRARLTPLGRRLLVDRVLELGWSPAAAADAAGVSRATCYKWLRRFREKGDAGLLDRSSRPRTCPGVIGPQAEHQILRAPRREKRGPHHLAGEPLMWTGSRPIALIAKRATPPRVLQGELDSP